MGLRINTNIAAQYALANLTNTNNKLSTSLNRLSTGLRINSAADDSAGMTIADGLKFQSTNLSQAIENGNNGINTIQIADMALQKSIDLVGQISQKAVDAANDTQDGSSRSALQSDINKLIEEINNISNTTSYKGTNLLDGTFTNKLLHVGAYSNQTLSISARRSNSDSIGWVAQGTLDADYPSSGMEELGVTTGNKLGYDAANNYVNFTANDLTINNTNVANYAEGVNQNQQLDAKTMAAAINNVKAATGVTATAQTQVTGTAAVTAGTISAGSFFINGQDMGAITVANGDADNNLVNQINKYQDTTGVVASKNASGQLILTADDGRNIAVKANANVTGIIHRADSETVETGNGATMASATAFSFYLNGTNIIVSATNGASTANIANEINTQLTAAGVNTTTQLRASYTGTSTLGGNLKLIGIDGRDINIHMTSAAAGVQSAVKILLGGTASGGGASALNFVDNQSNHGVITLTSTDNITVGGTQPNIAGLAAGTITPNHNLASVNVTSQTGAELAITIANSALSDLDEIRSGLGSVQNQIKATVDNITITQINVNSAESTIRDVNFAKESSNFSKLQILAQSGTYALSQANAVQQNVLRLLQ